MFFKKNTSENYDAFLEKTLNNFLLDGEIVQETFGINDKVYITNKRIIFKDILVLDSLLSIKNIKKTLEIIFVDFEKIDGISYIESSDLFFNRIIRIKSRGFSHDIPFPKAEQETAIKLCKYLSQRLLDLKK